jgi:hypothetical protein
MSDRKANVVLLAKLQKAQSKKPNPIRADEIKKLKTKIEKGKTAGPGDPISKRTARELMLKEDKPKAFDPTGVLGMKIPKEKKKKDVGYWGAGANSGEGWDTTDDTDYSSVGYWESGGDRGEGWDTTISSRRGGRLKRAALRGHRIENKGG